MQQLYGASQAFHKEWDAWSAAGLKGNEPPAVSQTRNKFWAALTLLFETRLRPLRQRFLADNLQVIDEVLDFLEVDIPAFRCGYEKEWYLYRLKFLHLNKEQQQRLLQIAYNLCRGSGYRRELAYVGRLVAKFVDMTFIRELQILTRSSNEYVRIKSERMLQMILNRRPDLKEEMARLVSATAPPNNSFNRSAD